VITRLRLKNWRSLRDVTIDDLQPINVFIGANASGKTNILDALYFAREMVERDIVQAVYNRGGGEKIRSLGASVDDSVEIEFTTRLPELKRLSTYQPVTWITGIIFSEERFRFRVKRTLLENDQPVLDDPTYMPALPASEDIGAIPFDASGVDHQTAALLWNTFKTYVTSRWQMLDENFMPSLGRENSNRDSTTVIDRCADNLVFMLDFMKGTRPDVYHQLEDDVRYLLEHVNQVQTERDEHEARLLVYEVNYPDKQAPTVSAGTARMFAMLAAYYALDMRLVKQPGLVVIEEPDTALNPGLLKNFVEQLREYVDRPEPRQFILTTHNPTFLNYFNPEEVRIVSRDEQGYTTVDRVPDYIKDIWLEEHGLGEVWLTNAFGGVAE
jgi:predicted ATPase